MVKEPNSFSKYLVMFVDILGSQNRDDFQEIYKINKIFHEEFDGNKKNDMIHTVYFRKIYTFLIVLIFFIDLKMKYLMNVKIWVNYLKWYCVIVNQFFYDLLKKEFFLEEVYLMEMHQEVCSLEKL